EKVFVVSLRAKSAGLMPFSVSALRFATFVLDATVNGAVPGAALKAAWALKVWAAAKVLVVSVRAKEVESTPSRVSALRFVTFVVEDTAKGAPVVAPNDGATAKVLDVSTRASCAAPTPPRRLALRFWTTVELVTDFGA